MTVTPSRHASAAQPIDAEPGWTSEEVIGALIQAGAASINIHVTVPPGADPVVYPEITATHPDPSMDLQAAVARIIKNGRSAS